MVLWASLWYVFLSNMGVPSSGAANGLVVLGAVRKQAEQAMKEHSW